MVFRYKGVLIEVVEGDITEINVEAIVNPANSKLLMGGGVAGAIKRKGGVEIEKEARRKAPVQIGDAVVTSAGKLPAKWVIHAPTVIRPAGRATIESVSLATKAALRAAEEIGANSIAFPAMGAGIGGLAIKEAVKAMLREIKSHIEGETKLERIILIAWGEKALKEFKSASSELLIHNP
ncbi:MAG TPA: macro domain-containing protein [Candidatus Korarchaeota archaeon]|nr:macro domain-containing protein [Candidatus Korarchaeota archaeon]